MATSKKQLFSNFFKHKYKAKDTAEAQVNNDKQSHGIFAENRETAFVLTSYLPYRLDDSSLWSEISGVLYKTQVSPHASVVLAHYDDGTILWLDYHLDDGDFSEFVYREKLKEWIPNRVEMLVSLLIETKLNYLGCPRLISDVSQIPKLSKRVEEYLSTTEENTRSLNESKHLLNSLVNYIAPPNIKKNTSNHQIRFYVWTQLLGQVFEIDFFFMRNELIIYECKQLAKLVGHYTIPR